MSTVLMPFDNYLTLARVLRSSTLQIHVDSNFNQHLLHCLSSLKYHSLYSLSRSWPDSLTNLDHFLWQLQPVLYARFEVSDLWLWKKFASFWILSILSGGFARVPELPSKTASIWSFSSLNFGSTLLIGQNLNRQLQMPHFCYFEKLFEIHLFDRDGCCLSLWHAASNSTNSCSNSLWKRKLSFLACFCQWATILATFEESFRESPTWPWIDRPFRQTSCFATPLLI